MLTDAQVEQIAYAAYQTHYRLNVINDADVALDHWKRNPNMKVLWQGMVASILTNAADMIKQNEGAVTEHIRSGKSPADVGRRLAQRIVDAAASSPVRGTGGGKGHEGIPGRTIDETREALGLAPGLAIGRCTEQPETPTDGTSDAPSEPSGDA